MHINAEKSLPLVRIIIDILGNAWFYVFMTQSTESKTPQRKHISPAQRDKIIGLLRAEKQTVSEIASQENVNRQAVYILNRKLKLGLFDTAKPAFRSSLETLKEEIGLLQAEQTRLQEAQARIQQLKALIERKQQALMILEEVEQQHGASAHG
ncbi:MAG TPA: hypothetical protein VGD60_11425 [Candidatus Acidoferrales bacterium]